MRAKLSFSLALLISALAFGQDAPPPSGPGGPPGGRGEGQWRDLSRVTGTIVSISGDQLVVKPQSGDNVTVKLDSDVRIRKDRAEAKLSDFKAGDKVLVAGTLGSDKVLTAKLLAGGEMPQGGRMMGGAGVMGTMGPVSPEDMVKMGLGTKFIAGEVKSIDETKITVARPDGQSQTIEVDETTSFRNGKGESGTLADLKVGDRVMGRGEMKNGVFVPQRLRFGTPQGGTMMQRHPGGPPAGVPPDGPPPQHQQEPK